MGSQTVVCRNNRGRLQNQALKMCAPIIDHSWHGFVSMAAKESVSNQDRQNTSLTPNDPADNAEKPTPNVLTCSFGKLRSLKPAAAPSLVPQLRKLPIDRECSRAAAMQGLPFNSLWAAWCPSRMPFASASCCWASKRVKKVDRRNSILGIYNTAFQVRK